MIQIKNELELFSMNGAVLGGKILLLNSLEQNQHLSKDEIRTKVVDDYGIMKDKHFTYTWKKYQHLKRFMDFNNE